MNPEVSIHLIVKDGEKYIEGCLNAVKSQTYPNIVMRIFDNNSTDSTVQKAKKIFPKSEIVEFDKNYFVGGAFNRSLEYSASPFVVMLCVDVVLDELFIEKAVRAIQQDKRIGVIQAKVLWYDKQNERKTDVLDTTGMQIFKSRRVINRGHGEKDTQQYNAAQEIFCYEGAVPFFRRQALESVKMGNEYLDEDFVWYADEVDLGWRMRLAGWKIWYDPTVLAWHDRSTTHTLSKSFTAFIQQRKHIDANKRMLDLRNQRLAFLKNDLFLTTLSHLPWLVKREFMLFVYVALFEQSSLKAYTGIIQMAPKMFKKRRHILRNKKIHRAHISKWFE